MIVYTSVFGGKDDFKAVPGRGYDLHLFTDEPVSIPGVNVRVDGPSWIHDPVRRCRCVKALPHLWLPPHDASIWIDASFAWRGFNPEEISKTFLSRFDFAVVRRYQIDCAYEESKICVDLKLDKPELIRAQMSRYRDEGFPEKAGLYWGGLIVRRDTPEVRRINEAWWAEICRGSRRDQLSLPYVLWKLKARFAVFDLAFESIGLEQQAHTGPPSPA